MMSLLYPESVLGFHSNFPLVNTPGAVVKSILAPMMPSLFFTEAEMFIADRGRADGRGGR